MRLAITSVDDQHHRERHEVLDVRHREREARRHETEVEREHVRDGADDRRARGRTARRRSSTPSTYTITMFASSKYGYIANATAVQITRSRERPGVAFPMTGAALGRRRDAARGVPARALLVGDADRDHVEAARLAHQLGRRRRPQPARASRAASARRSTSASHCASARTRAAPARPIGPSSVTVSAPSDSASRSRSMRRLRSVGRQPQQLRRLDVDDGPFGVQRVGDALAGTHDLLGLGVRTDGDEHAVARHPGARCPVRERRRARGRVDAIGDATQRELAQRDQVRLAEETLDRGRDLLRHVDLAGLAGARADRRAAGRSARPRRLRRRCGPGSSRADARR